MSVDFWMGREEQLRRSEADRNRRSLNGDGDAVTSGNEAGSPEGLDKKMNRARGEGSHWMHIQRFTQN